MLKLYALVLTVFITETFSQITIHPTFINAQLSSVSSRKIRDVGEPEMKHPSIIDEKKNLTPPSDKFLPPFMEGIINLLKNARRVHNMDDDSSSAKSDEVTGPIRSGAKHRVARQTLRYPGLGRGQIYTQRYPGMGRGGGFRQVGFNQNRGPYRMQGRGRGSPRGFGYPMYG